ncbi:hypothetical protein TREPR_2058 [Treponema primitia ZAS-2]|uniref:Uncharacterized protein n=1 Tax=Treponema primitia (strain ATCC BAA-887 / DSM 12427 / ZAS-2) TaxID=545694 RepID=F5YJS9_TREPZ|nr:hypothetical protein TREPR_2058 [Treponema primitia ZAS-2]
MGQWRAAGNYAPALEAAGGGFKMGVRLSGRIFGPGCRYG